MTAPERPPRLVTGRAGFTLLELVVALAVTGLVVTVAYLSVGAAADAAARNRQVHEAARHDRNARMVLTLLLRSARADPAPGADFQGRPAEARFVSALGFEFARLPPGEPVRVRIGVDGEGLRLHLAPLDSTVGGPDSIVLLPDVREAAFRFRDPESGEWSDDWERVNGLPAAVALAVDRSDAFPPLVVTPAAGGIPGWRRP